MFKNANNWHLSILVVVVSVLSLLLIQQNVFAQWEDPIGLPGESTDFRLLVNPLAEDLNLGGYGLVDPDTDSNFNIDATDLDIQNGNFRNTLCLDSNCIADWSDVSGAGLWLANGGDIYRASGRVGIGIANPAHTLHIQDGTGQLKLDGNHIYHPGSTLLEIESGGDLRLSADNIARLHIEADNGNIGIRHASPGYPLHLADNNDTAILNIENFGDDLWTGTRVARDGAERWFMGMGDAAHGTADELIFRANNIRDVMTLTSAGKAGVGTTDPQAHFEIAGDAVGGSIDLRLYNVAGSNSRILFKEYASGDDFAIEYNGEVGGFNNWLEFWGRTPSQHGNRPIMTLQRDYNPGEGNYNGVGIGVPEALNIDATLRVQNFGSEDILQLYGDDAEVFSVTDSGDVCINGDCRNAWPAGGGGPLASYTIGCGANRSSGEPPASCSASCLASDFVLTSWDCFEHDGTPIAAEDCIQGVSTGQLINSTCYGCTFTAEGTCSNFTTPPLTPLDSYSVSCGASRSSGEPPASCSVDCLASDYILTSWDCFEHDGTPMAAEDCIQGVSTGQLLNATCYGCTYTAEGICTKF